MKWFILALFIVTAMVVHYRGRVRHRFSRQVLDHSTFTAPINVFMYAFSGVPNQPYLDLKHFPQVKALMDRWEDIRAEAEQLFGEGHIKASDKYNDAGFNSFFKSGWKRFYLKWYDTDHPSARALCPVTTELVRNIPGMKAAMFTALPPGSRLPRHRDPYAGSLRFHMGLITPNSPDCYINVDGQDYYWRDGEAVVFDETFIHYAENKTEQNRIILFCDLERPMKYRWARAVNNFFGAILLRAAASPNQEGDRTGGINRIFGGVYAVRRFGKRIKKKNKTLYYVLKWLLVLGIFALIFL
ncbi:lipid A hydroxylase LpxO [Bordetella pseudohinzii]|uniref:Aspartyl beta-hydroxylase n=1 Tax=Bordetella pseudohinzii TaxID=1331258 RepID=A0A0J6C5U3_9BORD|nr:lipid A hydroxylase LpxO [Bordetella pseudohinzii]ANY16888.1 aspartyl beta-hydroxylase [Bordetella pseudohinzii]KMM24632.1 aspartyl beta-hydroxylase [Bordetella pseudohinzii]KXA77250.1 aspartyl beta-hydroxylase [Bordetella pseudohinzii]KXA77390.1 aspartyl beta-hydroxylase [Bordetella pseudohinzii]CUJ06177.1 Aspartyl/Asparaginyl beta-hydroxylase [Bordetella pseudohinzii]